MKLALILPLMLVACASSVKHNRPVITDGRPVFELLVSEGDIKANQAVIRISVPSSVRKFVAPEWYGGAPMFLKFVTDVSAMDNDGRILPVTSHKNVIEVDSGSSTSYTLSYVYRIPQKVSGEVDQSLPVMNESYARFDNNTTFLVPEGMTDRPARLVVVSPDGWKMATGWGNSKESLVPKVSQLTAGMIVMGGYEFSQAIVDGTEVTFGLIGDFDHSIFIEEFKKIFASQQEIAGPHPGKQILVVTIPTTIESAKGTSLTNALIVNVPAKTALQPFNFQVMGTVSHELFHQWNVHYVTPALEEGVMLFSEGFTNYFAIAALVRANLIPEDRFGRFLCRYQIFLEKNPHYPKANFDAIQKGQAKDEKLVDLNYTKGPFVAVLLDLALREDTGGKHSISSWFLDLEREFGGKKGYVAKDLERSIVALSGRKNGKTTKTFSDAFLGNKRIDFASLFQKLGVRCDKEGEAQLLPLPENAATIRSKLFRASN